jgi:hypothetical protein
MPIGSVIMWIELGTELVKVGSTAWKSIKESLAESNPELLARLREIEAEYETRIEARRRAAGLI